MASAGDVVRFIGRSGKRIAVAVAGFALVAVGLVMVVTPGPGLLAIIAGLAILATEFAWAERWLDTAKRKASEAGTAVKGRFGRSSGGAAAGGGDSQGPV